MSARPLAALVAALALLVAGCGSGTEEPGATATDRPADRATSSSDDGTDTGPDAGDGDDTGSADDTDAGGGGGSAPAKLCAVLSEAEAEALIGDSADLSATTDDATSCVYDTTESGELSFAIVQVLLERKAMIGVELDMVVEAAVGIATGASGAGGEVRKVDVGGFDGYLVEEGLLPMLFIAHGDDLLTVSVMGADNDSAAMLEAGGLVVGRL